jgi:uncharacterized cupin superfamily protein
LHRVNIAQPEFAYDPADPDGFRGGMVRLGSLLGAEETGASVYELPPGQALCPYHYEHAEEEWLVVLAGRPLLRHPDGEDRLDPWDVVVFPIGPAGAHGIRNDGEEPVRLLMFSTVRHPAVTVYPDSDKIAVWTKDRVDNLIVRRASNVDYYEGEPG